MATNPPSQKPVGGVSGASPPPPAAGRKHRLIDINAHLSCALCSGYLIDAVTLVECMHSYCRACLLQYLDNHDKCPQCDVAVPEGQLDRAFKRDHTLQALVYKVVPGVYLNELRRRRDFLNQALEQKGGTDGKAQRDALFPPSLTELSANIHPPDQRVSFSLEGVPEDSSSGEPISRRYFRCQGHVSIRCIKKLLMFKLGLTGSESAVQVEILHSGDSLTDDVTLMDIAYIYTWRKKAPLRLFFRLISDGKPDVPEVSAHVESPLPLDNPSARLPAASQPESIDADDDVMPKLTPETHPATDTRVSAPCNPPTLEPEAITDEDDGGASSAPPPLLQAVDQPPPRLHATPDDSSRPTSPLALARTPSPPLSQSSIFPPHIPLLAPAPTTTVVTTTARHPVILANTMVRVTLPEKQHLAEQKPRTLPPPPTSSQQYHPSVIVSAPSAPTTKKPTVEVRPEIRKKVATVRPKEPAPLAAKSTAERSFPGSSQGSKQPPVSIAGGSWPSHSFCNSIPAPLFRPFYHSQCSPFAFAVSPQTGAVFPTPNLNSGGVYVAVFNPGYPYNRAMGTTGAVSSPTPSFVAAATQASAVPLAATQPSPSTAGSSSAVASSSGTSRLKRPIAPAVSEQQPGGPSQMATSAEPTTAASNHRPASVAADHRALKRELSPPPVTTANPCPPPAVTAAPSSHLPAAKEAVGSKKRKLQSPVKRSPETIAPETPALVIDESPSNSAEPPKPSGEGAFKYMLKLAGINHPPKSELNA